MAGDDDFKPEYVEIKLMAHVAQKGFQAGSLVGLLGVVPVMAISKGGLQALSVELVTSGAAYGALGGTGLSLLAGVAKRLSIDHEGVEDRVYRLHYNKSQNRMDAFSAVGSSLGLAAAAYLMHQGDSGRHPPALNLLGGAAAGCAAGFIVHMLTRPADMKTANRALDQLRY